MRADLVRVLTIVERAAPLHGEGFAVNHVPFGGQIVHTILQNATFVVVTTSTPQTHIGRTPYDFAFYEPLGWFAWLYKGAVLQENRVHHSPAVFKVAPGADACRVALNPGMTGELHEYVPPAL